MWKSTCFVTMICLVHGVLPGPALGRKIPEQTSAYPSSSVLDQITGDVNLKKCGVPNKDELVRLLDPLRHCSLIPPHSDPPSLDRMEGAFYVCYALYDLLLRWCELPQSFSVMVSSFKDDKLLASFSVDKVCSVGGGELTKTIEHSGYTQTMHYVNRLYKAFSNLQECRAVCVADDKIDPLCEFLLIANSLLQKQIPPPEVPKTPKVALPSISNPQVQVPIEKLEVQPKPKEKTTVDPNPVSVESSKTESVVQDNRMQAMKAEDLDAKINDHIKEGTSFNMENTKKIGQITSTPNLSRPQPQKELSHEETSKNMYVVPDQTNIWGHSSVSKNNDMKPIISKGNIETPKVEEQLNDSPIIENIESPKTSNNFEIPVVHPNDQFKKDDYGDENFGENMNQFEYCNDADDSQDAPNYNNKDPVQPNPIELDQHESIKEKIDISLRNRENEIYRGSQFEPEDSNFFTYFIAAIGVFFLGYVIFHNKHKVLGYLLEGRRSSNTNRRRGVGSSASYRKLDCTLEEAVSSAPPSHGPNIVY